jgi:hypothetical protein
MNLRWMRYTLFGIQGLLAVLCVLWAFSAAHHLSQSHSGWSEFLNPTTLLLLVVLSTLAPPGLAAVPEGRVNGRRFAVISGIAVAAAVLAFAAGYYASRVAG